jgi:hypothetical protein
MLNNMKHLLINYKEYTKKRNKSKQKWIKYNQVKHYLEQG